VVVQCAMVNRILLLGPPGCGKTSVAAILSQVMSIPHIPFREIALREAANKTDLGVLLSSYLHRGVRIPTEIATDILVSVLHRTYRSLTHPASTVSDTQVGGGGRREGGHTASAFTSPTRSAHHISPLPSPPPPPTSTPSSSFSTPAFLPLSSVTMRARDEAGLDLSSYFHPAIEGEDSGRNSSKFKPTPSHLLSLPYSPPTSAATKRGGRRGEERGERADSGEKEGKGEGGWEEVEEWVRTESHRFGFLLDGYPDSVEEAQHIVGTPPSSRFRPRPLPFDVAFHLNVKDGSALREKLLARRWCAECGEMFSTVGIRSRTVNMPEVLPANRGCISNLLTLPEDTLPVIEKRLQRYRAESKAILSTLSSSPTSVTVELDGGRPLEELVEKICTVLKEIERRETASH